MAKYAALLSVLIVMVSARFNQEQIPIPAIQAVNGGDPGEAPTIAGAAISDLLGAANACNKLARGDQILGQLGNGADAVAAAQGIVGAEKNFNPSAAAIPVICGDPALPSNPLIRGITPLIDPDVVGSDIANALAAQTLQNPLTANGKSVAQLLQENGFSNFTVQMPDESTTAIEAQAAGGEANQGQQINENQRLQINGNQGQHNDTNQGQQNHGNQGQQNDRNQGQQNNGNQGQQNDGNQGQQGQQTVTVTVTETEAAACTTAAATAAEATATAPAAPDQAAGNGGNGGNGGNAGVQQSTIAGLDFGQCVPTMKFEGGLGGRPATEFTFLPIDPLCAQGQQEALNPNIITNRICDQLTNVCGANDAAKAACREAQAAIEALGTRDQGTADAWNAELGFGGAAGRVRRGRIMRKPISRG